MLRNIVSHLSFTPKIVKSRRHYFEKSYFSIAVYLDLGNYKVVDPDFLYRIRRKLLQDIVGSTNIYILEQMGIKRHLH